ncbi:MAG TPA: hypothetical protein VFS17_01660 [Methylophilaceae bacterium]|nr:hypothetical protein [Methylophilaceae bacterium]
MNISGQDFRKLRYPIIALGVVLILATLLVGFAENMKSKNEQAMQTQQQQLNQARQRYESSGQEKEIITKYLPLYRKLIEDGFIGEERRIEWVDGLRNVHQQSKLFGINYTISTQEEYKPSFALNVAPFTLNRSVMKLELAMLHEGDLLTLLNGLDAQETTPFIVRDCEITRVGPINTANLTPNLRANCELDWLTLREPQATKP